MAPNVHLVYGLQPSFILCIMYEWKFLVHNLNLLKFYHSNEATNLTYLVDYMALLELLEHWTQVEGAAKNEMMLQ